MTSRREIISRLSSSSGEEELGSLVEAFCSDPSDGDIAELAFALASSGATIRKDSSYADVASTGGPSSLSTVLCPLFLRQFGARVPKLAVPGRPAGGVDALATIPGYEVHLTRSDVENVLNRCGYAHFVADSSWAPLDAKLFTYRQSVGAQRVVPLVIASLLSKKIACGIQTAVIEIRVSPTANFGDDFSDARLGAERFVRVAALVGINLVCVLSDGDTPYQPYVGRGEALVGLHDALTGGSQSLIDHRQYCEWIARLAGYTATSSLSLREYFAENLEAQGSSIERFTERVASILASPRVGIAAPRSGFVSFDLDKVRQVLVKEQRRFEVGDVEFADPAGLTILSERGISTNRGNAIAAVRGPTMRDASRIAHQLQSAVRIRDVDKRIRAPEIVNG